MPCQSELNVLRGSTYLILNAPAELIQCPERVN
jgi:hypothetical protein